MVFHVEEGLGVAARVVDRVMGVVGFAEVFEVLKQDRNQAAAQTETSTS